MSWFKKKVPDTYITVSLFKDKDATTAITCRDYPKYMPLPRIGETIHCDVFVFGKGSYNAYAVTDVRYIVHTSAQLFNANELFEIQIIAILKPD